MQQKNVDFQRTAIFVTAFQKNHEGRLIFLQNIYSYSPQSSLSKLLWMGLSVRNL